MRVRHLIQLLKKDCPPEAIVQFECKKCGRVVDVQDLEVNDRKSGRATSYEKIVLISPRTAN